MYTPTTTTKNIDRIIRVTINQHHFNSSKNIPLAYLRDTHQPSCPESFVAVINDYCEQHGKMNLDTISSKIHTLYQQTSDLKNVTLTEIQKWVHQIFITDFLNGYLMEKKALGLTQELFPDIRCYQDSKLDTEYAVDIAVEYNRTLIAAIQVKPVSYLTSNPSPALIKNKGLDTEKSNRFELETGVAVFYLYYDNQGTFTNWGACQEIGRAHV